MSVASHPKPLPRVSGNRRVIQMDMQDPRWDAFVMTAPGATVFHHSGWLAALERENGQRPLKLACEEPDGTLSGVLPLMITRGLPFGIGGASAGPRLSSLPRTPIAGAIGASEAALRALLDAAVVHADSAGLRLQLKHADRTLDDLAPGLRGVPWRPSYVKRLPDDPDQLRFGNSRQHARITWALRKAHREGLRVRYATSEEDLRKWYRLYLDGTRWRALPPRPYRLFRAAWDNLRPGGFLRLILAYQQRPDGEALLAGAMSLMLGETAFYAFNGRLREALPLRPNDLLQWHALRDATSAGYRCYNFGEVEEGNEGLTKFKTKWDTEVQTLIRYHVPSLACGEIEYRRPWGAWAQNAALRAWRQLPLSATALAGDWIHRFL